MDQNRTEERRPDATGDDQRRATKQPDSGISNRPIEEEEENQERLPPRGGVKDETSHA